MPRVQDAIPSLACRAWKGCSNPLLLSALRFAPESRTPDFALNRAPSFRHARRAAQESQSGAQAMAEPPSKPAGGLPTLAPPASPGRSSTAALRLADGDSKAVRRLVDGSGPRGGGAA